MTTSQFKHPILRLEVLAPNGETRSEYRVFCRLQRESVRVDACCSCVHCDAITEGQTATVDCTMPMAADDPAKDPIGETTEIGTLLCQGTLVVADSTPVAKAFAALHAGDRRCIPIVDHKSALVGILHETGVVAWRAAGRHATASAVMSTAVALHERTPVRAALKILATNHLREATVVSDDGIPIGVFRDIDGLHWIRVARDSAPPRT